jgi:predicted O-methyltransferase YrrM
VDSHRESRYEAAMSSAPDLRSPSKKRASDERAPQRAPTVARAVPFRDDESAEEPGSTEPRRLASVAWHRVAPLADCPVTESLRASPPRLHGAGDEFWGLAWPALAWLERTLTPGMTTLETGAGSSTLVFAAAGVTHLAVTVDAAEEVRIRHECARRAIDTSNVRFLIGPSQDVLARRPLPLLDLALIDGAHGFPYPILDWWHLAPRLRVGGLLVLDDCYMPPVRALVDHLRSRSEWRLVHAPGRRTVVAEKLGDGLAPYEWRGGRIGGRMSFAHLPPARRMRAAVAHRLLESGPGRRSAARLRRALGPG